LFSPKASVLNGIVVGLAAGLVFGLAMAVVINTVNNFLQRHLPPQVREAGPRCSTTFTIASPADAVLDRAAAALKARGARVGRLDRAQGRIVGRTAPSLGSWGERITVQVVAKTAEAASATVSSVPRWFMTIIDYGKGFENVEAVAARLGA
jgi:hypothetical protein